MESLVIIDFLHKLGYLVSVISAQGEIVSNS